MGIIDETEYKEQKDELLGVKKTVVKKNLKTCYSCKKEIDGKNSQVLGRTYHKECLLCYACKKPFGPSTQMVNYKNEPHCTACSQKETVNKPKLNNENCKRCNKKLSGKTVEFQNEDFHYGK
jgi:hypothetical protein